jgi:hypothetical protein
MTIEAQLKAIHEELVKLNGKFEHIGQVVDRPQLGDAKDAVMVSSKPAKAEKSAKGKDEEPRPAIPYDKLSAAVKGKAAKHRAAVVEVLGSYGVKNAQELKPEQYAEVLAKIEAIK